MAEFLVTGLSELRSVLLKADKVETTEIRALMKTIGEPVVKAARVRMESQIHDPRSVGRLGASMKPASTVRSASIVLGTPVKTAYAGWWEFGGPRARSRRPPNRAYVKEGRSLYPSLAEARPEIQEATEQVIVALVRLIDAD